MSCAYAHAGVHVMGVHDGHRERMRERIDVAGIDSLQDHEVLEYLLFSFVPRRNTNDIAHALIEKFGSFSDVLNADAAALSEVPGMTENAARFLASLPAVLRRYAVSVTKRRPKLAGRRAAREYLAKEMFGLPVEVLGILALDARDGILRFHKLAVGTGDSVTVSVRQVAEFAMTSKAVSVIMAHNHPGGDPRPSQSDYDLTCEIAAVLSGIGVPLADHIIFTDTASYSFEENGLLGSERSER